MKWAMMFLVVVTGGCAGAWESDPWDGDSDMESDDRSSGDSDGELAGFGERGDLPDGEGSYTEGGEVEGVEGEEDAGAVDSGTVPEEDSGVELPVCPEVSGTICFGGLLWEDPELLVWENSPITYYEEEPVLMSWDEARAHCDQLELGGYTDWRLPSISELRGLVEGCAWVETEGGCNIHDDYTDLFGADDDCTEGCPTTVGPVMYGCYWPEEVDGPCGAYWSSTAATGAGTGHWGVWFGSGQVGSGIESVRLYGKCVRELS